VVVVVRSWIARAPRLRTDFGITVIRYEAVKELFNDSCLVEGLYEWTNVAMLLTGRWTEFFASNASLGVQITSGYKGSLVRHSQLGR